MTYKLMTGTDWLSDSFNPTTLPVANDQVIIPHSVTDNKTDATNQANDIDLDLLQTHPGFTGAFGSSGTPIQVAADLVIHQGSGPFYYECTDNGSAALTTDVVRIEAANSGVVCVLSSDATASDGDFTKIYLNRGNLTLDGSIVFDTNPLVQVGFISDRLNDATLTIASSAPTLADMVQLGGQATTHNLITTLRMCAGIHFKETAACPNCFVYGGTLVYNDACVTGDNVTIEVFPGATLDLMRNSEFKDFDKVIAHPGATILKDDNMHNIQIFEDWGANFV